MSIAQITTKCNEGKLPLDKEIKDYMTCISKQVMDRCFSLQPGIIDGEYDVGTIHLELEDIQDYIDLEKWGDMYIGLLRRLTNKLYRLEYEAEDINRNIPAAFYLTVEDQVIDEDPLSLN